MNPLPFAWRRSLRRSWSLCVLLAYVYLSSPRVAVAEDHISAKWQDYAEDDGRVRVISRYFGVEKEISPNFVLKAHGVHDAISGATPTGAPSTDGNETVPKSNLVDVREAGVIDLDWIHGVNRTSFQFAYSSEDDFLSKGYSISNTSELNKRNTGVTTGISIIDDTVRPNFFDTGRDKDSLDLFLGLSQVLDKNTVVALNFTYGEIDGYLNDPYKLTSQDVIIEPLPDVFIEILDRQFAENRPGKRERRIVFGNVKRFFPEIRGSLDVDYRYFDDNWGIESHTIDFEWYQKFGDNLVIRPKFRVYRQSGADFYGADFDGASFDLNSDESGLGPYFASDYRLAKFDSETYGVKVVYKLNEKVGFDVDWERYVMKGKDEDTSQDAFPSADILTIGSTLWF
ncbi:MAG: DUF3570 domain-containing protein [Verrucomicrobiota bacterium]